MQYTTSSLFDNPLPQALLFDVGCLFAHLQRLTDQRHPQGVRYPLPLALSLVILAKLAGEDEPRGIAQWVKHRQRFRLEALAVERQSVPHQTTYSRILGNAIVVDELQQVIAEFLLAVQPSP